MLTLRLDKNIEQEIEKVSKSEGISKSELIRKSINEYLLNRKKTSLYGEGKVLFGKYSFDNENLSVDSEKILRKHFKRRFSL